MEVREIVEDYSPEVDEVKGLTTKEIIGNVVIAGALIGLAFISYNAYKEYRKELDRAREEFDEKEAVKQEEMKKELDDIRQEMLEKENEVIVEEEIPPSQTEIQVNYYREEEGVEDLRHNPNSIQAINQYKEMLSAEIRDVKVLETLWPLWDVMFRPQSKKDRILRDTLLFDRIDFFGEDSVFVKDVSFAEVILYYAEKAKYDINYEMELTTKAWLYHLGIFHRAGAYTIDKGVRDAVNHDLLTPDGLYTMFGLDEDGYQELLSHLDDEGDSNFNQECNTWLYFEEGVH